MCGFGFLEELRKTACEGEGQEGFYICGEEMGR